MFDGCVSRQAIPIARWSYTADRVCTRRRHSVRFSLRVGVEAGRFADSNRIASARVETRGPEDRLAPAISPECGI
jgi:hypothetical protein